MRRTLTTLTLSLIVAVVAVSNVTAELATEQEMQNVAENWLTDIVYKTGDWGGKTNPKILSSFEVRSDDGLLMARIYNIDPKGYIAVPILKEMPPVKMYSDKSNLDESHTGGPLQLLKDVLLSRLEAYEAIYDSLDASQSTNVVKMFGPSHGHAWDRFNVSTKDFKSSKALGSFVEGEELLGDKDISWDQRAPYNNSCPLDPLGSGNGCAVGCVATAAAQIMKYWEWPPFGAEEECSYNWDVTYHYNSLGNCVPISKEDEVLAVNLSDGYDWENIPDNCHGGCSPEEQTALAELNYEVGVAFRMSYGFCGSGAVTSYAATVFPMYFRYQNTTTVEHRNNYTLQEWYNLIKQEVDAEPRGRPMQYRIYKHSIVCDGYRYHNSQYEYHMNYGCDDDSNDWYILDELECFWVDGGICPFEEEYLIAGIEPPQDETPPYCVSYSVGSTPSTDIDVVFSEDMDQSTFTNSNITVVGSISGSHPWSFSFVPGTFTLTIVPDVNFDYDETVTVTISTGVTDLAGNALESECSFDFEIGSCTWFVVTPWAGANGSISPSEVLIVCQGDDVEFTATPNTGYEVDRWFVNGIEEPFGGTNFTVYDIQSSVSVVVWFKVKPEPSGITVLSPNGGEVYEIDGRMTIIWTSTGDIGNHVRIELWRNGAFERLIEESEYNDGSTSWGIPWDVPAGGCYKVRIYSVADPSIWDESDDCFEIVPEIILPDTLLIYTIQDLQDIGSDGAHPSDTLYKLMNDINASGFPFQPIGPPYFTGVLDGQGYSVQYLEYKDENEEDVGLFSRIDYGGVVKNLTLLDPEFEGDRYVGAFAGHNAGSIINCTVTATVSGGGYVRGNRRIGGIAGRNVGVISQCAVSDYDGSHGIYVRAKVQHVGGIAGVTGESSTDALIAFCFVDCDIRGVEDYNGGIAGGNYATIIGCGFEGALYGSDWGNGGIVGLNHSGLVKHCYFVGYLQGDTFDGGIVGGFYGGTIENCYSAGTMVYSPKGGIVGRCSGTITNSFWDTQVTGCSEAYIDGDCTIINSHGETTSEMKKKATFTTKYGTNWDFDNVWAINEGVDYPKLRGIGDSLSAPDNVAASSDQSDGVHVSWDPVSFDAGGGSYSAVYSIYRSDSPDANPPETEVTGWREGNTLVDSTAVPGATYYYWVQAAAGMNGVRASELGGPAQGQRTYPLADTPTGILASDSLPHSIVIEWDEANVANFYQVYRSISVGGSKDSLGSWQTGLSYSDIPAYPDTVYYYWVRAAMDDTGGYVSEYGGPDSGYYIEPDDIAPTVSISLSPAYPIETQSCTLHVSAADNEALGYVALRWSANGVQDSAIWDNIGAQTLDTSHIIGAFSANDTIECWARALDVSDNPVESQHLTKIILFENVSQPSHPMGPVCLKTNQLGEFETGGSITNLDSPVQYRFNWADSISSWGDSTASRTWDSEGAYLIKSQARSLSDTNRVSVWSVSLLVVVDSMPPEVVIRTYDKTIVDTVYNTESVTISGDSRDDEPSSGLASTEINTGAENKGDEYDWSFDVSLDEGSNIFVITSTDNAGNVGVGTLNLILVGVDDLDEAALPDRFALNQNYPNPFNPATVIEFDLPRRSHVSIAIFNLLGQKVAGLIDEEYPAGSHQITWDGISTSGQRSASGIYFYRLVAEDFINTKKMILLK